MRRAKPATGFGLSGKLALALIVVMTATGGFLLGYFVGKSAPVPSVSQILPIAPAGSEQPALAGDQKAVETLPPTVRPGAEKVSEKTSQPASLHQPTKGPLKSEPVEKPRPPAVRESPKESAQETPLYTVQVGAFKSLQEANALKGRLEEKGFQAEVKKVSEHGKMMYKVIVGGTAEKKEADVLALRLRKSEGLTAFVTKKN